MGSSHELLGALGEDALIQIFASDGGVPGPEVLVPNGDDAAAFLVEPGQAVVVTTDALVEGSHFDLAHAPAESVGRKLLAVNLSDLAAMGAVPRYALLALALPTTTPVATARAIARGAHAAGRAHGVLLLGGNVARISGPMVLTATLLGQAAPSEIITRRGARPGDVLMVTGRLGEARAGFEIARAAGRPLGPDHPFFALHARQIEPTPRIGAGRALARFGRVHAMCDVSDGLGRDVGRLLEGTNLGAEIDARRLPISEALRAFTATLGRMPEHYALAGGEDYELLFTVAASDVDAVVGALAVADPTAGATAIGVITDHPGVDVISTDGTRAGPPAGFDHFAAVEP